MAILKGGALHGKVGNLVYYIRNGVPCVRAVAKPSSIPPTPAQLAQRWRMKLATQFLAPLAPVLDDTIKVHSRKKLTGMNWATQKLLQDAVAGEYPDLHIQPSKVLVSLGALAPLRNPLLALGEDRLLTLQWEPISSYFVDSNDQAFLLVYNQTSKQVYLSHGTASRGDGRLTLAATPEILKGMAHCYGFVLDRSRRSASNSVFVGTLTDGAL